MIASTFGYVVVRVATGVAPLAGRQLADQDRPVHGLWRKLWIIGANPVESGRITGVKPGIRSGEIRDKDARGRYPQIHRWKTVAGTWKTAKLSPHDSPREKGESRHKTSSYPRIHSPYY
jgi:hypothetical protein